MTLISVDRHRVKFAGFPASQCFTLLGRFDDMLYLILSVYNTA